MNREILIQPKSGEQKPIWFCMTKHHFGAGKRLRESGQPLTDGAVTPSDILAIKGPTARILVTKSRSVPNPGVKINDKHFEVIVRQMMKKVEIIGPR